MNEFDEKDNGEDFDAEDVDEGKTLSLLGGIAGPEGLPEANADSFGKRAGSGISSGTLLVAIVAIVGVGGLFAMIQLGKKDVNVSGAVAEHEAKIDTALARLSSPQATNADDPIRPENMASLFDSTEAVVSMFTADVSDRQVPLQFLKKNPFLLPIEKKDPTTPKIGVDPSIEAARLERERMQRMAKLEAEVRKLDLQSVVSSSRTPLAIINGEIMKTGTEVGSFTITSISGMSVELTAGDDQFTLSLESKEVKRTSSPIFRR